MELNIVEQSAAIRDELDDTRYAFYVLLGGITEAELDRPTGFLWTIRAELIHIIQVNGLLPRQINQARRLAAQTSLLPTLPFSANFQDWVNEYLMIPVLAPRVTRGSLARHYDLAYARIQGLLTEIGPTEWGKGVFIQGGVDQTVEDLFHRPARHFQKHADRIQSRLERIRSIAPGRR